LNPRPGLRLVSRGLVAIKGKGTMKTFWVTRPAFFESALKASDMHGTAEGRPSIDIEPCQRRICIEDQEGLVRPNNSEAPLRRCQSANAPRGVRIRSGGARRESANGGMVPTAAEDAELTGAAVISTRASTPVSTEDVHVWCGSRGGSRRCSSGSTPQAEAEAQVAEITGKYVPEMVEGAVLEAPGKLASLTPRTGESASAGAVLEGNVRAFARQSVAQQSLSTIFCPASRSC
jgi:hypothetical protein